MKNTIPTESQLAGEFRQVWNELNPKMRFYVATNAIKIEKLLGLNPLNRLYEDIKNLIKQSHLGPEDKKILDDRNLAFICAVNSPKLNEEDSTNLIEEISHIIQPSKLEKICYLITSSIL